jgi:hypothetical protein
VLIGCVALVAAGHAAERRTVLVIGNSAYKQAPLVNPGNDARAVAQALRPAASAPVSARVAYAAWLEQMELRDEARKYWRALSAERPGDEKLKALAAE